MKGTYYFHLAPGYSVDWTTENVMALGNDAKSKSMVLHTAEEVKKLSGSDEVNKDFINILADKERARKAMAMAQLYEAIGKQRIEVQKISKPLIGYDDEGKEVNLPRTKEQHEAKKKAEERLQKMENAFTKAFEKGEYKDVFELVQQLGSKDKGGSGKESSGDDS